MGFSIINHPLSGTHIYGNPHFTTEPSACHNRNWRVPRDAKDPKVVNPPTADVKGISRVCSLRGVLIEPHLRVSVRLLMSGLFILNPIKIRWIPANIIQNPRCSSKTSQIPLFPQAKVFPLTFVDQHLSSQAIHDDLARIARPRGCSGNEGDWSNW